MGDTSDFTFCKVGSQSDDDPLESPKGIPNVKMITLDDNHLDTARTQNIDNSVKDGCLYDNTTTNDVISSSFSSASVNEISPPPPKLNAKESLTPKAVGETGDSLNGSQDQKPISKKSAVRAKVPFEKGYSQMDWLKLTRTSPDLAGLKGQSNRRLISMDEVRKHGNEGSVWTVLKGRVYNISPYMKFHPGGVDMLMKAAGKDCTSLFNKYHAWVNAEFLLEKCLVGVLDDNL